MRVIVILAILITGYIGVFGSTSRHNEQGLSPTHKYDSGMENEVISYVNGNLTLQYDAGTIGVSPLGIKLEKYYNSHWVNPALSNMYDMNYYEHRNAVYDDIEDDDFDNCPDFKAVGGIASYHMYDKDGMGGEGAAIEAVTDFTLSVTTSVGKKMLSEATQKMLENTTVSIPYAGAITGALKLMTNPSEMDNEDIAMTMVSIYSSVICGVVGGPAGIIIGVAVGIGQLTYTILDMMNTVHNQGNVTLNPWTTGINGYIGILETTYEQSTSQSYNLTKDFGDLRLISSDGGAKRFIRETLNYNDTAYTNNNLPNNDAYKIYRYASLDRGNQQRLFHIAVVDTFTSAGEMNDQKLYKNLHIDSTLQLYTYDSTKHKYVKDAAGDLFLNDSTYYKYNRVDGYYVYGFDGNPIKNSRGQYLYINRDSLTQLERNSIYQNYSNNSDIPYASYQSFGYTKLNRRYTKYLDTGEFMRDSLGTYLQFHCKRLQFRRDIKEKKGFYLLKDKDGTVVKFQGTNISDDINYPGEHLSRNILTVGRSWKVGVSYPVEFTHYLSTDTVKVSYDNKGHISEARLIDKNRTLKAKVGIAATYNGSELTKEVFTSYRGDGGSIDTRTFDYTSTTLRDLNGDFRGLIPMVSKYTVSGPNGDGTSSSKSTRFSYKPSSGIYQPLEYIEHPSGGLVQYDIENSTNNLQLLGYVYTRAVYSDVKKSKTDEYVIYSYFGHIEETPEKDDDCTCGCEKKEDDSKKPKYMSTSVSANGRVTTYRLKKELDSLKVYQLNYQNEDIMKDLEMDESEMPCWAYGIKKASDYTMGDAKDIFQSALGAIYSNVVNGRMKANERYYVTSRMSILSEVQDPGGVAHETVRGYEKDKIVSEVEFFGQAPQLYDRRVTTYDRDRYGRILRKTKNPKAAIAALDSSMELYVNKMYVPTTVQEQEIRYKFADNSDCEFYSSAYDKELASNKVTAIDLSKPFFIGQLISTDTLYEGRTKSASDKFIVSYENRYDSYNRLTSKGFVTGKVYVNGAVTNPGIYNTLSRYVYDDKNGVKSSKVKREIAYIHSAKSILNPSPDSVVHVYTYDNLLNQYVVKDSVYYNKTLYGVTDTKWDVYRGLKLNEIGMNGDSTVTVYDGLSRPTVKVDPLKNQVTWEYNDKPTYIKETDAFGVQTIAMFNGIGKLDSVSRKANGATTAYSTIKVSYNSFDKLESKVDEVGITTNYQYDKTGRLTAVKVPQYDATKTLVGYYGHYFIYSDLLYTYRELDANSNSTTFNYDKFDFDTLIIRADSTMILTSHDNVSKPLDIIDPKGLKQKLNYDKRLRLSSIEKPDGITIFYRYDDNGKVVKDSLVGKSTTGTVSSKVTDYNYDLLGRATKEVHKKLLSGDSIITSRAYDVNNSDNSTNLGRVTSEEKVYCATGDTVGNRYEYDKLGRVTIKTMKYPHLNTMNVSYGYNKDKLESVTGPNDSVIAYGYDALGRMKTVSFNGRAYITVNYRKDDLVDYITYKNGIKCHYNYHPFKKWLLSTYYTKPNNADASVIDTVYKQIYEHDRVGNIVKMRRFDGEYANLVYDKLYQLTAVGYETGGRKFADGSTRNLYYKYDANGNRLVFNHDFNGVGYGYQDYEIGKTNNINTVQHDTLMGVSNLSYDYQGNQNSIVTTALNTTKTEKRTYNLLNEVTNYTATYPNGQTVTANYAYDTKGWRIKKQVGSSSTRYYIYEGVNVLCEFEDKNNNGVVDVADGEGWDYHMYFGLKKIADIKADGREEFYITDHLGTVNAVLDKDAATIQQYAFDPYGNMEYAQGRSDNRYLFTGKEFDPESGVFYFGARYYDSKAGRWLARDPKEEFFSSYVYCGNNPLGFVDPDGEGIKEFMIMFYLTAGIMSYNIQTCTVQNASKIGSVSTQTYMYMAIKSEFYLKAVSSQVTYAMNLSYNTMTTVGNSQFAQSLNALAVGEEADAFITQGIIVWALDKMYGTKIGDNTPPGFNSIIDMGTAALDQGATVSLDATNRGIDYLETNFSLKIGQSSRDGNLFGSDALNLKLALPTIETEIKLEQGGK